MADRDRIERKLKGMFSEPKTHMIIIHTLYVFIFCKSQREKIISLGSQEKRGDQLAAVEVSLLRQMKKY